MQRRLAAVLALVLGVAALLVAGDGSPAAQAGVGAADLGSALAARAPLVPGRLIPVGPGISEDSLHLIARTLGGVVYIVGADDGGNPGLTCQLRMYRGDRPLVPTAFREVAAATAPHCTPQTKVSGGDVRLDHRGVLWISWFRTDRMAAAVTTFDTRTDRWGPTTQVTTRTDQFASHPGVRGLTITATALDAADRPVIAVSRQDGLGIWQPAGTGWVRTALVDPQPDDGHGIWHPSLTRDRSFGLHLAWERWNPPLGREEVRYATRPNGGRWSRPEVVAAGDVLGYVTGLDAPDQGPSLTIDGQGHPVVAWVDPRDGTHVATRIPGHGWSVDGPPSAPFAHNPAILVNGDRRLLLLGHDKRIHPAWLTSAAAGAPWSAEQELSPPPGVQVWSYDGSASDRDDPAYDTDCAVLDTLFMDEDSDTRSNGSYLSDLYYVAFRVAVPPKGCAHR